MCGITKVDAAGRREWSKPGKDTNVAFGIACAAILALPKCNVILTDEQQARQHHVRATDQGREIAVECFDVHRGCADGVEKPGEAGKLVIGEWLGERPVCHGGLYGCARRKGAAWNLLPKVRVVADRLLPASVNHADRLYDVKAGKHRGKVDRVFVAKRVVPEEVDVLPGDG